MIGKMRYLGSSRIAQRGTFQGVVIGSIADGPPRHFAVSVTDSYNTIKSAGYFNDFAATLQKGDTVFCQVSDGTTYRLNVISNTNGVVGVADAAAAENSNLAADIASILSLNSLVTSLSDSIDALTTRVDTLEATAPPDLTPPSNVTGFTATVVSSSQINLAWNASTDPESGVAAYHIYDNAGAQPIIVSGGSITYSHTGLGASEFHEYTIYAINGSGLRSSVAATISATTNALPAALPTVSTGTVTPTNNTKVMGISGLAGTNSPTHWLVTVAEAAAPAVDDLRWDTLQNWENGNRTVSAPTYNQAHNYRIWCKNDDGVCQSPLLITGIVTNDTLAPNVPTGLNASVITSTSITVAWNVTVDAGADGGSGTASYRIRVNSGAPITVSVPTTNLTLVGLSPSTQYSITVSAVDAAGNESNQSNTITPTTSAGTPPASATIIVDSATGDDSYTYAQVTSDPATYKWRTLGRAVWGNAVRPGDGSIAQYAAEAAKAGDIVDVYGDQDYPNAYTNGTMLYTTANQGSTQNGPIIFRAIGTVNLTHTGGGTQRMIFGAYIKNYIQWEGDFRVTCSNFAWTGDRAPLGFWQSEGSLATGFTLVGIDRTAEGNDNWSGVRAEYATNCVAKHGYISGFKRGNSHGYGVITYDSQGCDFSNLEIWDCNAGMQLKGQRTVLQLGNHIHHNHIHDCNYAGLHLYGCGNSNVYLNLIREIGIFGIYLQTSVDLGTPGPHDLNIVNNVLYRIDPTGANVGAAFAFKTGTESSGTTYVADVFANNIVHTAGRAILSVDNTIPDAEFADLASLLWKHNLYYNIISTFADLVTNRDWTAWRNTVGQDNNTVPSILSDPLFTNPGTLDFTLQGGSPAIGAGRDILLLDAGQASDPIDMGLAGRTVGPT